MDFTQIKVTKATRRKLNIIKAEKDFISYEELQKYFIKLHNKNK